MLLAAVTRMLFPALLVVLVAAVFVPVVFLVVDVGRLFLPAIGEVVD